MTDRNVPNLPQSKLDALVEGHNELVQNLRRLGLIKHGEQRTVISTADATDLATSVALSNALKAAWNLHCASTKEHAAADATNVVAAADATDLASAQTLLNELKGDFNAHVIDATVHGADRVTGDGRVTVATVATVDATDQATANALATSLKRALNGHFQSGARLLVLVAS